MEDRVITRGQKAGGKKTNLHGLSYEKMTDLVEKLQVVKKIKHGKMISFEGSEKQFLMTKQSSFFKCMSKHCDTKIKKAHGCKNPDECYVDLESKIIFIIEKKFQQTSGSVCEKIQTPDFKIWQYSRTFPDFEIVYIYCLSRWFEKNCEAELEYLKYRKIPVFWGNSETYKEDIIKFMTSYK